MTLYHRTNLANLKRVHSTSSLSLFHSQTKSTSSAPWVARSITSACSSCGSSFSVAYTHYRNSSDEFESLLCLPQFDGEGSQSRHIDGFPPEYQHSPRVNPFVRRDSLGRPVGTRDTSSGAPSEESKASRMEAPGKSKDGEGTNGHLLPQKALRAQAQHGSEDSHNDFQSGYATPNSSFDAEERASGPTPEFPTSNRKFSSTLHAPATCSECMGRIFGPPLHEHVHLRHVGRPGNVLSPKTSAAPLNEEVHLRHTDVKRPTSPGPSTSNQEVRLRHADIPAPKLSGPSHLDHGIHLRSPDKPVPGSPSSSRSDQEPNLRNASKVAPASTVQSPLDQKIPLRRVDRPAPIIPSPSHLDQEIDLRHADLPAPASPIPFRLNEVDLRRLDSSSPSTPRRSIDKTVNLQDEKEATSISGQQSLKEVNTKLRHVSESAPKRRGSAQTNEQVKLRPVSPPTKERFESAGIERQASLPQVTKSIEQFERGSQDSTQVPMPDRQRARALSIGDTRAPMFQSLESLSRVQALPSRQRSESSYHDDDEWRRTHNQSPTTLQLEDEPHVSEKYSTPESEKPHDIAALTPSALDAVPITASTEHQPLRNESSTVVEPVEPLVATTLVPGTLHLDTAATLAKEQPLEDRKSSFSRQEKGLATTNLVPDTSNITTVASPAEGQLQKNGKLSMPVPEKTLAVSALVPATVTTTAVSTPTDEQLQAKIWTEIPALAQAVANVPAIPATIDPTTLATTALDDTPVKQQNGPSSAQSSEKAKRTGAARKPAIRLVPLVSGSFLTVPKVRTPELSDGQEDLNPSNIPPLSTRQLPRRHQARLSEYELDHFDEAYPEDAAGQVRHGNTHGLFTPRSDAPPARVTEKASRDQSAGSLTASTDFRPSHPGSQGQLQDQLQNKDKSAGSANLPPPSSARDLAQPDTIRGGKSVYFDLQDGSFMGNSGHHGLSSGSSYESDDIENAYIHSMLHPDERDRCLDESYRSGTWSNSIMERSSRRRSKLSQNQPYHFVSDKIQSMPDMLHFIDSAAVDMGLDLHSGQFDDTLH